MASNAEEEISIAANDFKIMTSKHRKVWCMERFSVHWSPFLAAGLQRRCPPRHEQPHSRRIQQWIQRWRQKFTPKRPRERKRKVQSCKHIHKWYSFHLVPISRTVNHSISDKVTASEKEINGRQWIRKEKSYDQKTLLINGFCSVIVVEVVKETVQNGRRRLDNCEMYPIHVWAILPLIEGRSNKQWIQLKSRSIAHVATLGTTNAWKCILSRVDDIGIIYSWFYARDMFHSMLVDTVYKTHINLLNEITGLRQNEQLKVSEGRVTIHWVRTHLPN